MKMDRREDKRPIDFDDMLEELGELGRFQIFTYILVCLPVFFSGANSLSYVFTADVPNYRCLIPECEHPSNTSYNAPWVTWTIPQESGSKQVIGVKSDACNRFVPVYNSSLYNNTCTKDMFSNVIEKCSEWVFDDEERTIVNDWNITCIENQWKISLVGSSHFAGIIIGSLVFGVLADRYGRKFIFIFCIFLMSAAGSLQVLSPNYVMFVILIFLNSLGTAGVYPLAFIIGVEMVGKKKRELTGIVLNYFYAVGEAAVAAIAWYTRDWIYLQLLVSAPAIIFIGYYWIVPESVRWLLANKQKSKAKVIVLKAAKVNRVILSDFIVDSFNDVVTPLTAISKKDEREAQILPVVKEMGRSSKLVIRFTIVYFIWAVNAFIYYGLSINATSLVGNKYVNFALVSLIEIPGYTLGWVCIEKLGRRISLVGSLLLCGITCLLTIFANNNGSDWTVVTLFLLGKLGITSAFGIAYVYTAEMLPTIIRSGGVGAASTFARVGALLAPFVPMLGLYYSALPMILFGVIAIVAGILGMKLPETLGIKLPETADEAKKL